MGRYLKVFLHTYHARHALSICISHILIDVPFITWHKWSCNYLGNTEDLDVGIHISIFRI